VNDLVPTGGIDAGEQIPGTAIPGPSQVHGQRGQIGQRGREVRSNGEALQGLQGTNATDGGTALETTPLLPVPVYSAFISGFAGPRPIPSHPAAPSCTLVGAGSGGGSSGQVTGRQGNRAPVAFR